MQWRFSLAETDSRFGARAVNKQTFVQGDCQPQPSTQMGPSNVSQLGPQDGAHRHRTDR
jgi:hypothetical protein